MDSYGGYEMIQSPRVTESERPIHIWHGTGRSRNTHLNSTSVSPLKYPHQPSTCTYSVPHVAQTSNPSTTKTPPVKGEGLCTIAVDASLSTGLPDFLFSAADRGLSSKKVYNGNGIQNCSYSSEGQLACSPVSDSLHISKCENEAWWSGEGEDENQESEIWDFENEEASTVFQASNGHTNNNAAKLMQNSSEFSHSSSGNRVQPEQCGESKMSVRDERVNYTNPEDSQETPIQRTDSKIDNQDSYHPVEHPRFHSVQITKLITGLRHPVFAASPFKDVSSVSLVPESSPLASYNRGSNQHPSLISNDPTGVTYTRRILSAFHQWKYDVGSTICAYVHNMKNWTGLGGDEFFVRDFVPTESTVFLLGQSFSLLENQHHSSGHPRKQFLLPSEPFSNNQKDLSQSNHTSLRADMTLKLEQSETSERIVSADYEGILSKLETFIDSLVFMSYRKDFPPMYRFESDEPVLAVQGCANTPEVIKVTSDAGWGCTIRCTQMLLFEVLKRHFPKPEDVWVSVKAKKQTSKSSYTRKKHTSPLASGSIDIGANPLRSKSTSSPTVGYQVLESIDSTSDENQRNITRSDHLSSTLDTTDQKEGPQILWQDRRVLPHRVTSSDDLKKELLLRWFLDVPSPPEDHPFSVYAFVRSAGGGFGWAHPLYGQMALESKLLVSLYQQQRELLDSKNYCCSLVPYRSTLPSPILTYLTPSQNFDALSRTDIKDIATSSIKRSHSFELCRDSSHQDHTVIGPPTSKHTGSYDDKAAATLLSISPSTGHHLSHISTSNATLATTVVATDEHDQTHNPLSEEIICSIPSENSFSPVAVSAQQTSPEKCESSGLFQFCPIDGPDDPIFFGKRPGDWFGPATASYSMKYIVETARITKNSLSVYVNADGVLDMTQLTNLFDSTRAEYPKQHDRERCNDLHHYMRCWREEAEVKELLGTGEIENFHKRECSPELSPSRSLTTSSFETESARRARVSSPDRRCEVEEWQFISNTAPKRPPRGNYKDGAQHCNSPGLIEKRQGGQFVGSNAPYLRSLFYPLRPMAVPFIVPVDNKTHERDFGLSRRGVLLCFPLTLGGGRSLNEIYHSSICRYFELPWFVGAIGAKAGKKQAFYFVGKHEQGLERTASNSTTSSSIISQASKIHRRASSCSSRGNLESTVRRHRVSRSRPPVIKSTESLQGRSKASSGASEVFDTPDVELLYLDPHIVQTCATDAAVDWDTFHHPRLFRVSPRCLDPGILIAFYCPELKTVLELALCIDDIAKKDRHAPLTVSYGVLESALQCLYQSALKGSYAEKIPPVMFNVHNCKEGSTAFPRNIFYYSVQQEGNTSFDSASSREIWSSRRRRRCQKAQRFRSGNFGSAITSSSFGSPLSVAINPHTLECNECYLRQPCADSELNVRIRERHNSDGFVELSSSESPRAKPKSILSTRCSATEDSTSDSAQDVACFSANEMELVVSGELSDHSISGIHSHDESVSPSLSFFVVYSEEKSTDQISSKASTSPPRKKAGRSVKRLSSKQVSPPRTVKATSTPSSPSLPRNRSWFTFRPSRQERVKRNRRTPRPLRSTFRRSRSPTDLAT